MGTLAALLASGSNARGQLANGTVEDSHTFAPCNFIGCLPGKLPSNTRRIVHIASGSNHALVLLERQDEAGNFTRELWGCGDGGKGQLGPSYSTGFEQKPEAARSVFRPLDLPLQDWRLEGYACRLVASAWETSYVVLSCDGKDDVVLCIGADDYGDLGNSDSKKGKEVFKRLNVVKFDHFASRGRHLDHSPLVVESLSAGPHHVIVHVYCSTILTDSSGEHFTVGWGSSRHGQLGPISKTSRIATSLIPRLISNESISHHDRIISSALGNQHSVFMHASGRISHLGSNKKGQLRDLIILRNVQSVDCTWNGTYAVVRSDDNHTIYATGSHIKGQLGRLTSSPAESDSATLPLAPVYFPFVSSSHRLVRIACGSEHVLALFGRSPDHCDSGIANEVEMEVWGWGWNEHGNLGTGTTEDIKLPSRIWPGPSNDDDTLGRAVGIWAGCGTSWMALNL